MAFTGELEQLHIVDIIQLLNTTRKSGTFSVTGEKGESRIIFSNGHIVGASHLNNKIRIGTVLVKMNAITIEDLKQALTAQKNAGKKRKPLIITLIELGKLERGKAAKGLKKLIEITLVELVGWSKGTFTLDTDAITVSPECSYPINKMEQEISLDAQMILMDALRIFDERKRDSQAGNPARSDEELFVEVLPSEEPVKTERKRAVITADDLGLGDLDHLERKIPEYTPVPEVFDPAEIHRQKIKEMLAAFSGREQEIFVSFLEKSTATRKTYDSSQRRGSRANGLIFFSGDELVKHSVMTICKSEDVLVFALEEEDELDRTIEQCLKSKVAPVVVFDSPGPSEGIFSKEKIAGLRQKIKDRYPRIPILQIASLDYAFTLQSLRDGAKAVLPRPHAKTNKTTFVEDMIKFLETFKSYLNGFFDEQKELSETDKQLSKLKARILELRSLHEVSDVSLSLLKNVSEICERSITFLVHAGELAGEKAIGVYAEKDAGPTSVTRLKVPLMESSVLHTATEKGHLFYGEADDEILKKHLYEAIGEPLSPTVMLLPVRSRGRVVVLAYGDFGGKEAQAVQTDILEILADEAGIAMENIFYRKQLSAGR